MFTWSKQGDFHQGLLLHCHQQCPGDPTGEPRGRGTPVVTTAMGRGHVEVGRGQLGARQSHCSARGLGACISPPLAHHMAHPPTTQRRQRACKASMPTSKKNSPLTAHLPASTAETKTQRLLWGTGCSKSQVMDGHMLCLSSWVFNVQQQPLSIVSNPLRQRNDLSLPPRCQ